MSALTLFSAILALQSATPQSKIDLEVFTVKEGARTALKSGEVISGDTTFRVIVQTTDPIQAVEFYVGEEIRETDGSTPYEFKMDTLSEQDGDIKVRFRGFTTEGRNAEKAFNLKVDNKVSLGAAAHVEMGQSSLNEGKLNEALISGRIALKADKNYLPAKVLLAKVNFAKGTYDVAQKFAEDVLEADKSNRAAKEVLISLKVQQAFTSVSRSGADRSEVIRGIKKGLSEAINLRQELLNTEIDRLSSDKNSLDYLDACIRARRYSLISEQLEPVITKDFTNVEFNNRLLYAYIMQSQVLKANLLLGNIKKFGKMDGYTYALAAVAIADAGVDSVTDDAIKEAILNAPDSLGVRSAQAYIALKRDNNLALGDAARSLARDGENRNEAHYFAAALNNRLNRIDAGRRSFERAIKADANDHDMYVEQGCEAIGLSKMTGVSDKDKEFQLEYAKAMFELALQVRPSSGQALSAMAILYLYQKKTNEAVSYSEAATRSTPQYAGAWYVYAAALSARRLDARGALAKASQLDPRNLLGRAMPDTDVAFKYFNTTGRTPVISFPERG